MLMGKTGGRIEIVKPGERPLRVRPASCFPPGHGTGPRVVVVAQMWAASRRAEWGGTLADFWKGFVVHLPRRTVAVLRDRFRRAPRAPRPRTVRMRLY